MPPPSAPSEGKRSMRASLWAILLMVSSRAALAADGIHWTIVGPTSVAFDWRGAETTLDFGTSPGAYTRTESAYTPDPLPDSSPGPYQEAILTGLASNTLYYYRIGEGPEHTFRTPPPAGSSDFWFAVQADIGSSLSYPVIAPTQAQIAADEPNVRGDDRPRFVLVPGDLTYGDQNGIEDVDAHFNDVQTWSQDAAYMPSWGNHEWNCLPPNCSARPDNLNNYEGRFVLPNTQSIAGASLAVGNGPADDWGWFDYGNVRFISMPSLDMSGSRSAWQTAVGPIMAEAQADPSITFIVAYGHFPAWSSGSDHGGDSSLQATFTSLRASYPKFFVSFQGHSHHYERTNPFVTGGVLSTVTGGGGAACGGVSSGQPLWAASRANEAHHLKIHVGHDFIEGWAICGPTGASGCNENCEPGSVLDHWSYFVGETVGVGDRPKSSAIREGVFFDVAGRRVDQPLSSGIYFRVRAGVREVVIVRK